MPSQIYLESTLYDIHFAYGTATAWAGVTGTPWTVPSTTPFEIANNDTIGTAWTPTAAVAEYGYGPAVTGGGSLSATSVQEPDTVTETIPIQIVGTTPNARLKALQVLRRLLQATEYGTALQLVVEPNDTSSELSAVYYEVLHGSVQEDPRYTFGDLQQQSASDGRTVLGATMTLVRRAFGGRTNGDGVDTLINASTFTNTAASNTAALNPSSGDLIYGGQPLNITVAPNNNAGRVYLASLATIKRDTTGFSASGALSTTYATIGTADIDAELFLEQYPVTPRLFIRLSNITGGTCTIRANLILNGGTAYHTVDGTSLAASSTGRLLDMGDIPIPLTPGISITAAPSFQVQIQAAGTATAVTIGYVEVLFYYEFAIASELALTSSIKLGVSTFPQGLPGRALLPFATPIAHQFSGSATRGRAPLLGEAPLARANTILWVAWTSTDGWGSEQNTSHTAVVTATHAPLYRTLRAS